MNLVNSLLHLPSMWLVVLGIIAVITVLKVIRSVFGTILSLVFTGVALFRVYLFLSGKL